MAHCVPCTSGGRKEGTWVCHYLNFPRRLQSVVGSISPTVRSYALLRIVFHQNQTILLLLLKFAYVTLQLKSSSENQEESYLKENKTGLLTFPSGGMQSIIFDVKAKLYENDYHFHTTNGSSPLYSGRK